MHFFHSEDEFLDFRHQEESKFGAVDVVDNVHASSVVREGNGDASLHRIVRTELGECEILEEALRELQTLGFEVADFFVQQEEMVTGEKTQAKFSLRQENGDTVAVENLFALPSKVRELGRRGVSLKRFKGLGEMNAEELWETTMDRSRRTLRRVNISEQVDDPEQFDIDAREADHIFSVLMGGDVEARREFIENNAINVRNLDI